MKDIFKVGGWVYDPETLVVRYGLDDFSVRKQGWGDP